jgi:hypothetical protein
MSEILKKDYEISLWEEDLIWMRQQLKGAPGLKESTYNKGTYYS